MPRVKFCRKNSEVIHGHGMNTWGIPGWLESEVKARDKSCVYCGIPMMERVPPGSSRKMAATWEHIVNDAKIITPENIARCCASCNSSKGQKKLARWIESAYCQRRGITKETVADVVKQALNSAAIRQETAKGFGDNQDQRNPGSLERR